jgi:hypothetical protein
MTIAFGTIGAKAIIGTTTVDVPYPSSPAVNDMFVSGRVAWLNGATFTDEAGWTSGISSGNSYNGGTGSIDDSHTSVVRPDYKIAAGAETGNVTFDQGGTVTGVTGIMARYTKDPLKEWFVQSPHATMGALETYYGNRTLGQLQGFLNGRGNLWYTSKGLGAGATTTHAANRSITTAAMHLQPGDMLIAIAAIDTDVALTISANTFTASGITFGTVSRRTSGVGSSTGNDGNIELWDALVTAGTADVPITFAFTTATTQCGAVAILRLREINPVASYNQSHPGRRVMTTLLV